MLLKQGTSGYLSQWSVVLFVTYTSSFVAQQHNTFTEMRRNATKEVLEESSPEVEWNLDRGCPSWHKWQKHGEHLTLLFLNEHIEHILNICLFFIFESPFKKSEQFWELSWSNNVRQLSFHTDENHKKVFVDAVRSYTLWISLTKSQIAPEANALFDLFERMIMNDWFVTNFVGLLWPLWFVSFFTFSLRL